MGPTPNYRPPGFPSCLVSSARACCPLTCCWGPLGSLSLSLKVQRKRGSSPREWAGSTGIHSPFQGPTEVSLVLTGFSRSQWPRIPECTGPLDGLLCVTSRAPQQGLLGSWLPDDPRAPTPVIQRRVSRERMEPCAGLATKMPGQCGEAY